MAGSASYRTVKAPAAIEIVINRSRFIGQCIPIPSEAEALDTLTAIRKRYWDATHNCYAYSIGQKGEIARFSDDGEPGGTAGMPMMDALRGAGVTDVLCVPLFRRDIAGHRGIGPCLRPHLFRGHPGGGRGAHGPLRSGPL